MPLGHKATHFEDSGFGHVVFLWAYFWLNSSSIHNINEKKKRCEEHCFSDGIYIPPGILNSAREVIMDRSVLFPEGSRQSFLSWPQWLNTLHVRRMESEPPVPSRTSGITCVPPLAPSALGTQNITWRWSSSDSRLVLVLSTPARPGDFTDEHEQLWVDLKICVQESILEAGQKSEHCYFHEKHQKIAAYFLCGF